jgi:hypothetical protein
MGGPEGNHGQTRTSPNLGRAADVYKEKAAPRTGTPPSPAETLGGRDACEDHSSSLIAA